MASHTVNPGLFKSKDAEPEATLELFDDYCETMERVFRLSRRLHPATCDKLDFDEAEKKDLILVEGVEDMQNLFKHGGLLEDADSYKQVIGKIKAALKKRGNCTSAAFKLFNSHSQGSPGTWRSSRQPSLLTGLATMPRQLRWIPESPKHPSQNCNRG